MRVIVQTRADLDALRETHPALYREQLIAILGSCSIRTNQAAYPDDYNSELQPGDAGYIAPLWVEIDDTATLRRLGFESRAALEAALADVEVVE